MTTCKFQCISLLFSKVVGIKVRKIIKVIRKWKDTCSDRIIGLETQQKILLAFYASKLQDYREEGLLFQNIPKPKNHQCWPRSPIISHSTKLGYATFCSFCDAGSQKVCFGGAKRVIFYLMTIFSNISTFQNIIIWGNMTLLAVHGNVIFSGWSNICSVTVALAMISPTTNSKSDGYYLAFGSGWCKD